MIDQGIWRAALGRLQVELSSAQYAAWLRDSTFVEGGADHLVVGLPNAFARETVERNFLPLVRRVVSDIAHRDVAITLVTRRGDATQTAVVPRPQRPATLAEAPPPGAAAQPLRPRLTFESFVVGEGNRMASAAAISVSRQPGRAYNPLFLYGGVGLGKTHLLKAIAHEITSGAPGSVVRYVTCEDFTYELVSAIRAERTSQLRAKYRSADVLLFDDIQFIAGRESTQAEVFNTFDALYAADKQIVLASDRSPQAISPLSDRLATRFAWGLVADIQPPDLETRLAILQSKAESMAADVPYDVLQYIASSVTNNVRDLEGALTRVLFYADCVRQELTIASATRALDGLAYRRPGRALTLDEIIDAVSDYFGVAAADISGPGREKRLTLPRHIAMFIMREETSYSYPAIGSALGGRDHTTVLHGYRKIAGQRSEDPNVQLAVESIRATLRAPS